MSERSYHIATSHSEWRKLNGYTMKDRYDDPSHHERTLLPQSYISLWRQEAQWVHHEGWIRRSIAPWVNRRTLLPRSYISLWTKEVQWVHHEGSIQQPITPWANALTTELHLTMKAGSSMDPPWRFDPTTNHSMSKCSYQSYISLWWQEAQCIHYEGSIQQPITPWANTLTTELHLTLKEAQSVHHEGLIRRSITPWANALTTELHLALKEGSSMGPPWRIDPTTNHTMSKRSYHRATSCSERRKLNGSTTKDRSNDPSHLEWMLLPQSYISLWTKEAQWVHHEGSIQQPITPWANALTRATSRSEWRKLNGSTMKDRSDDPSHHEWTIDCSYHGATSRFERRNLNGSTTKDRSDDPSHLEQPCRRLNLYLSQHGGGHNVHPVLLAGQISSSEKYFRSFFERFSLPFRPRLQTHVNCFLYQILEGETNDI